MMAIRIVAVLILTGLIVYWARLPSAPVDPNEPPSKYEMEIYLEQALKDAGSAEYKNQMIYPDAKHQGMFFMCGEVNAKNSFGAYTGFKRFVVSNKGGPLIDDGHSMFEFMWKQKCKEKVIENPLITSAQ